MLGCLDFGPDFTNNPILINKECLAIDAHVRFTVHVFLFPHLACFVGDETLEKLPEPAPENDNIEDLRQHTLDVEALERDLGMFHRKLKRAQR